MFQYLIDGETKSEHFGGHTADDGVGWEGFGDDGTGGHTRPSADGDTGEQRHVDAKPVVALDGHVLVVFWTFGQVAVKHPVAHTVEAVIAGDDFQVGGDAHFAADVHLGMGGVDHGVARYPHVVGDVDILQSFEDAGRGLDHHVLAAMPHGSLDEESPEFICDVL